MGPTLTATPNPVPAGTACTICLKDGDANKTIEITCDETGGTGQETFKIKTDAEGGGCYDFTAPAGWGGYTVSGGGATVIIVTVS